MTDLPDFSILAGRFLARVNRGLEAARAALAAGDHDALRRELRSLCAVAAMFGFHDIAHLSRRAESLVEMRPIPLTIVDDLLDGIDEARCAHTLVSEETGRTLEMTS
jgi:HPt (histidine-containing phosphotransfer) domain-containing protein